jgi:hypothetical protein
MTRSPQDPIPAGAMQKAGDRSTDRYGYFVVQANARRTATGSDLSGVMEDLTTGEKQAFASAAEVARLMVAWADGGEQSPSGGSNEQAGVTRTPS